MNIKATKLIYFSPTGTTRKVMEAIAHGARIAAIEHVDLTLPDATVQEFAEMYDELAIIGSPVYNGRLPTDAASRLRKLRGNDARAVIIVVYGNQAFEDALLELRDLVIAVGFKPVAAGTFIGEHSYSNNYTPIAVGRPDTDDLRKAMEFGMLVHKRPGNMPALADMPPLQVPGNYPYRERGTLSNISPVTEESVCIKCKECAAVCPTAAIRVRDTVATDRNACIRCCACIKACSTGARSMEDQRIRLAAEQLSINCSKRKEPETYFCKKEAEP